LVGVVLEVEREIVVEGDELMKKKKEKRMIKEQTCGRSN
jgi:hypothetical protein